MGAQSPPPSEPVKSMDFSGFLGPYGRWPPPWKDKKFKSPPTWSVVMMKKNLVFQGLMGPDLLKKRKYLNRV